MTDEQRTPRGERALDPAESWGQGTDETHPESATGQEVPTAAGTDAPRARGSALGRPVADVGPAQSEEDDDETIQS